MKVVAGVLTVWLASPSPSIVPTASPATSSQQQFARVLATVVADSINLILVAAIMAMFLLLAVFVLRGETTTEVVLRSVAFVIGLLLVLGVQAIGLSVPGLLAPALSYSNPIKFAFSGLLLPSLLGFILAWVGRNMFESATPIAARWLVLIAVVILVEYAEVYVQAASRSGFAIDPLMMPNVAFLVAVGLYAISSYGPPASAARATS
jgi:hypothetical protein